MSGARAGADAVDVVIVAGGTGSRAGAGPPKQFRTLGGRPVLAWSLDRFVARDDVTRVIVVLPEAVAAAPPAWLSGYRDEAAIVLCLVPGGESRAESVEAGVGLAVADRVLIHDAARPFASAALVDRVLAGAGDAVIPTLPLSDTIKRLSDTGRVIESVDRRHLAASQTPQRFATERLRRWISATPTREWTDEATLFERAGDPVSVVRGEPTNLKLTTAEDFAYAAWLIETGRVDVPEPMMEG